MFTCLFFVHTHTHTHILSSISIKQSRNQINETQLKVHVMQLIGRHIIHRKFTRLPCVTELLNSANGSYPDTTTIPVTSSSRVKFLAEGNKAIAVSIYYFLNENTKFLFYYRTRDLNPQPLDCESRLYSLSYCPSAISERAF